jgi:hypothetical protein
MSSTLWTSESIGIAARLHCWPCEKPARPTAEIGVSLFAIAVIVGISPV